MTKYQQLDHLESGWKKGYLLKKIQQGLWITRHQDLQQHQAALDLLAQPTLDPEAVRRWLDDHLDPAHRKAFDQALRARRRRYFASEQSLKARKTIDLTTEAWQQLSGWAQKEGCTLSQAIQRLMVLSDAARLPLHPER